MANYITFYLHLKNLFLKVLYLSTDCFMRILYSSSFVCMLWYLYDLVCKGDLKLDNCYLKFKKTYVDYFTGIVKTGTHVL